MARHDADFAFAWGDDAGAVRANEAHAFLLDVDFHVQHIQSRNAFGDADDQRNAGISGFDDRIFAVRRRYVDNRCIGFDGGNGFAHGVEHRQAKVGGAAFTWGDTANHFGAVGNRLFAVESALFAGEALANDFGVFVN